MKQAGVPKRFHKLFSNFFYATKNLKYLVKLILILDLKSFHFFSPFQHKLPAYAIVKQARVPKRFHDFFLNWNFAFFSLFKRQLPAYAIVKQARLPKRFHEFFKTEFSLFFSLLFSANCLRTPGWNKLECPMPTIEQPFVWKWETLLQWPKCRLMDNGRENYGEKSDIFHSRYI